MVYPNSLAARFLFVVGIIVSADGLGAGRASIPGPVPGRLLGAEAKSAPLAFYTLTAELALARHEPRVAALQYSAAADIDPDLWPRAVEVAVAGLQPSLSLRAAQRWMQREPGSVDAHRAAGSAALALHKIELAAVNYEFALNNASDGRPAEYARLEKVLRGADNAFGARQVADRLAKDLPVSAALLRIQGYTALRADDPAAAARSFGAALAQPVDGAEEQPAAAPTGNPGTAPAERPAAGAERNEVVQAWRRARVLAGAIEAPLAEAAQQVQADGTSANRFDYGLLLWTAKRDAAARTQLQELAAQDQTRPDALRVLGLLEMQAGNETAAETCFSDLASTGAYADDAFYYLGVIADRRGDLERALRSYARVQGGDNLVPALLRAATILHAHGAAQQSEELLDRLAGDEPAQVPEILSSASEIYAQSGQAERSLALLEQGRAEYPDSVDLRYALATRLEERGQIDSALRELRAVFKERPDDPAAMNALGFTLADHSRELSHARSLIERALAAAPKSAAIRDSFGWVLYRQGHPDQALPYLSGAFADEPGGDIGAHLGEVLWQLDHHAEAERIWTEAHRVDGENKLLQSTRARLHREKPAGG